MHPDACPLGRSPDGGEHDIVRLAPQIWPGALPILIQEAAHLRREQDRCAAGCRFFDRPHQVACVGLGVDPGLRLEDAELHSGPEERVELWRLLERGEIVRQPPAR